MKNTQEIQLNRMEFILLDTLYTNICKDRFHSMTLSDKSCGRMQRNTLKLYWK